MNSGVTVSKSSITSTCSINIPFVMPAVHAVYHFLTGEGGGGSCYRGYKLLQGCLVVIRTLAPGRIPTHKLTLLSGQEATLLHGSRCLIEM